ncbi:MULTISPECIES: ATP-binding cassette domain-containing protein [Bradyrhizobium]|uniref:ABC transporter ATP-binding protein n=2 Tax=Bradyrhizobium TaxID=374 RepID=A0A9X1UE07_9BRAD|nr:MULTISPECIES: ABC transporter ATP-binding protein [Bradyrhizobium]MCG2631919.1 ABC transporter ATP-binding protein [Bradyrhizobium zhengyangense]MCG2644974.1 ABC transporter ATP-binding protein [Bradyrhizobium zhengyangense]MCG2672714.1 ABC transporter ATP-binding protein [Bradyrhizobium zhengyangense]MDN4985439.1 ABC transporter ATP-binding protein [Bradyrhizobium sp. WYCCWR 13022]MDN5002329.1 ABC transporter ATP-binding protein [Bradyrhizobium sp. WYCCWR 12677]
MLDNDNRERLARGLAGLAEAGAQLLVTTHDRKFARSLVAENRAADRVEHLSVHPVNAVRPTLIVSPAIEEIDRGRHAFHMNSDSASDAQNYAACASSSNRGSVIYSMMLLIPRMPHRRSR